MHADDLILISPSSAGLCMYECETFGTNHVVKYNTKRSAIMLFRYNKLKGCNIRDLT